MSNAADYPVTRHVVWVKAYPAWSGEWIDGKYVSERIGVRPVDNPGYEPAGGGGLVQDINRAQVFGWAKRAMENLERYRKEPDCYDVIPVDLVPRRA